jgi:hypothetical protein
MKRMIGIGIVAFWLVMIGLLIGRNLPESSSSSSPSFSEVALDGEAVPANQEEQEEKEEWMGVYHQNQKVGYIRRRLTPTDTGYVWDEQWRMRLNVMDTLQTVHTVVHANVNQQYALNDFSFRMLSSGVTFQVKGHVVHKEDASNASPAHELQGEMTTGGNTSPFSFPLTDPIYLPATTQMAFRHLSLQPGQEYAFRIFNPLSMRPDTISIEVIGPETITIHDESIATTKVAERFAGTTVHAWLDHTGQVVKEEASLGMVLLRESEQKALGGGWQDQTPLDLVASAAISVDRQLPNPRGLSQLQLTFSEIRDDMTFAFPPRQQHHDRTLSITREDLSTLTTYTLPQADQQFTADLIATPFLQSTHPRLTEQAQNILGSEQDAVQATRRLLNWTYTNLEKIPTIGIPTALEALDSKRGDCNEHAVLFTALARASGLPARVAAGVVYLEGAFYYHAWSEVWLGQWVSVDPALGQFPADATHVKFLSGGPEEHMALLKIIGNVDMEIVDYQ